LGGQYSQLIARRVRECRVYSELVGHTISPEAVRARNPYAVILSGGPASVYADDAPHVDPGIFELGIPTLGICYGMQLMALDLGGRVDRIDRSADGRKLVVLDYKTGSRRDYKGLTADDPDRGSAFCSAQPR